MRLARHETGLNPPVNIFTDLSKAVLLLWSSWLLFVMSNCEVVTYFPIGILGQVWCLIVSIPDISLFLTSHGGSPVEGRREKEQ